MDARVLRLLEDVAAGSIPPQQALERLGWMPSEPVANNGSLHATSADTRTATDARSSTDPFARVDHHRTLRVGFPEVVFAAGKTTEQTVEICARLEAHSGGFLATRVDAATLDALAARFPSVQINRLGRTAYAPFDIAPIDAEPVLILSAGTSDLPVAEEAAVTATALGARVQRVYDVGVAGIHRLLEQGDAMQRASVVLVVAGMEGALPSVVGGLVATPVIAVPTSVGYGASFNGLAALLGMLNSCAAGLTVVNIDNGFGAACAAIRILRGSRKPA
jgi:NCAIR mutase (PurE)-related protein